MQKIPKTLWEATAMRKHPEILELRERIRPLAKTTSYARQVASAKTEARTALSNHTVLQVCSAGIPYKTQLVMEYLEHAGLEKVIETIEEESYVKCRG